jgi:GNAT superfamily N-acetyltransferase
MAALSPADLASLAAAALPDEGLSAADLETCCFGPDTEVFGDGTGAAALTVKRVGDATVAWLLFLVVHPESQGRGRGRALLDDAVRRARDRSAAELHLGNAAPRYVWPGVDLRFTAALALFESSGFEPYGAECNMEIGTAYRAGAPAGVTVDREEGGGAVDLARRRYPHWVDETERAVERGTCFAAREGGATLGFACHSVNRSGWIGPIATGPASQRRGVGRAMLATLCADLSQRGHARAEIAWVAPVGFFAKCGAHVSRRFRTAKLRI